MTRQFENLRLCITGSFGNTDIGDEAMLTEDLDFILNELRIPRENIYLIGHRPEYISFYHSHPPELCLSSAGFQEDYDHGGVPSKRAKARLLIKNLLRGRWRYMGDNERIARSCRALLVTGGGTINTRDPEAFSLRRMRSLVSFFKKMGKPVFMSGQTIGPLGIHREHDAIAREIVGQADVLTVRDGLYSRRYLEAIGAAPKELIETVDDACALPYKNELLPDDIQEFISSSETAAVNITEYTSATKEMLAFIAEICERLVNDFRFKIILTSHIEGDYPRLLNIFDMLSDTVKGSVVVPDTRLWRDRTLKKMISCCRVAIGGRYHFIVFAGTSHTPFVGMCGNHYSYIKQDGFARRIGMRNFILSERDTWNMEAVIERIKEALKIERDRMPDFERPSVSMQRFGKWVHSLTGV